jgi:hypothetical protein
MNPSDAELTQAKLSFMFVAFLTLKYIWQLLTEVERVNSSPLFHTMPTLNLRLNTVETSMPKNFQSFSPNDDERKSIIKSNDDI